MTQYGSRVLSLRNFFLRDHAPLLLSQIPQLPENIPNI